MLIKYVSYGLFEDGGYFHEKFLFDALTTKLSDNISVEKEIARDPQFYTSIPEYFKLLNFAKKNAQADVTITVGRMGLSIIKKNTGKTIIVFHNYDENDGKSRLFKFYLICLFKRLTRVNKDRICIVVPAKCWKVEFDDIVKKRLNVFVFPNFFEIAKYRKYNHLSTDKKLIHLGMWSSKNSDNLKEIAKQLSENGFKCYFSTSEINYQKGGAYYDIIYFDKHDEYIRKMSQANYTLAYPKVREGWGRVAHESILCGTTLIGLKTGGLTQLLLESGQIICNDKSDFVKHIMADSHPPIKQSFINKYADTNTDKYLKPIVKWIQN